jgi:hypothetical protein
MPLDSRRRAARWMARKHPVLASGQVDQGLVTVETEQGAFTPDGGSGLGDDNSTFIMSAMFSCFLFIGTFINNAG